MGLTITGGINFTSGFALISPGGGGGGSGGPYWIGTLANASYYEAAYSVAIDTSNNIHLSGRAWGGGTQYDVFFGKLDTAGALQMQYTFGSNATDISNGITVDSSGNIYVCGYLVAAGSADFFVTKFNSVGVLQWGRLIPDNPGLADAAYSVKVDNSGNVFACGTINNDSSVKTAFLVKTDANGSVSWKKTLTGTSEARSLYLDSSGNVYLSGLANISGVNKMIIAKFDSTGVLQWTRSLGSAAAAQSNGLVIDSLGNIYICGFSGSPSAAVVAKYDSSGTLLWQRQISGANSATYTGIAIDSSDNVYLSGYYTASGTVNALVVTKYDSSGNLQWKRAMSSALTVNGYGISIDGNNDIVVCGYVYPISTHYDIIVAKLPNDGSKTGTYTVGSTSLTYSDWGYTESAASLTSAIASLSVTNITNAANSLNYNPTSPNLTSTVTQL